MRGIRLVRLGGWDLADKIPKRFIVTGSRRYGFPTESSDIDIICTSLDPYNLIQRGFEYISGLGLDGESLDEGEALQYPDSAGIVRFNRGRVDLLLCSKEAFLEREEAMRRCVAEGPVSRDRAVEIHKQVEEEFEERREAEIARLEQERRDMMTAIKRAIEFRNLAQQACLIDV